jgi:hypothetical protein
MVSSGIGIVASFSRTIYTYPQQFLRMPDWTYSLCKLFYATKNPTQQPGTSRPLAFSLTNLTLLFSKKGLEGYTIQAQPGKLLAHN